MFCLCFSTGQQVKLKPIPVFPQCDQEEREGDGGANPGTRLHERRDEVGNGGDEHQ